jgi:hypothetical protein
LINHGREVVKPLAVSRPIPFLERYMDDDFKARLIAFLVKVGIDLDAEIEYYESMAENPKPPELGYHNKLVYLRNARKHIKYLIRSQQCR